jgi:hypothetical protein
VGVGVTGSALTWDIARAGGMVAYVLLTASVSIGLIVSLKWRSPKWTRFVTTELHRFVTLLALIFTGIHTLAVAVDPFIQFTPAEVLVPFLSHYRPLWVALGIVGAYLAIAVYVSEWVRPLVGYAWWRRFHYLSFVAFIVALVHGLGTGSDSRAPWAIAMYAASAVLVAALIALRALPARGQVANPLAALVTTGALVLGAYWAWQGPLQPGWNAIANNGNGSGGATAAAAVSAGGDPPSSPGPSAGPAQPFSDTISGRLDLAPDGTILLSGTLQSSGDQLSMRFRASGDDRLLLRGATVALTAPNGDTCSGQVQGQDRTGLVASCQGATSGAVWTLHLALTSDGSGAIQGSLQADPAGG